MKQAITKPGPWALPWRWPSSTNPDSMATVPSLWPDPPLSTGLGSLLPHRGTMVAQVVSVLISLVSIFANAYLETLMF